MKALGKILTATAATGAAYFGLLNVVENLLVKRKWTIPQAAADMIANADMTELAAKGAEYRKQLDAIGYEKHCMMNDRDEKLAAWLIKAEKESKIFVLCCHGYRANGRDEYCGIAQYYHRKGYNVFMVDHTASGDSEGNYAGFGYFEAKDSIKWINYLKENFGDDIKIILHGISMGAATVMIMSGDKDLPDNVKMIVTDCGYTSAVDEFEHKLKEMHLDKFPAVIPFCNALNRHFAGYDFRDTDAYAGVRHAKVPMLFIHGSKDVFVPTYMSEENYDACTSEIKDLLIIDGADHAQSYIVDPEKYENKIDEFIERVGLEKE